MPLSWNEIRSRALAFSKEWEHDFNEDAEAKSFLDAFFNVFGISRRRVATFEKNVKKIDGKDGYIDLLWKGNILIEQKSKGKNLDKAYKQATGYFPGLKEEELPKCILVCDFEKFRLYDLEEGTQSDFLLKDFHKNVKHFGFLLGYQKKTYKEQDPVNIEAAEKMGKLHDHLKEQGYEGHQLEIYLVRLVFCLFADDTGIFEKDIFHDYLKMQTREDGSDLALHLAQLFQVLNTDNDKRQKHLDEALAVFPYVNGKLFEENLQLAAFDSKMRTLLIDCCNVDWSKISPAIFGSLFQSVMNPVQRRNLGAHYTSEKNILKVIKPLFLDGLWKRFEKVKSKKNDLKKLHDEISLLRFLDPACGCGNFLIIAYRELRILELEIIKELLFSHGKMRPEVASEARLNIDAIVKINVDRFYGIEYEEFPAQIAQVAMWLIDHQMNTQVSETFGENYIRLPLRKSATIAHGNALRIDWQTLINPIPWEKTSQVFNYIFGNPPFGGSKIMSEKQRTEIKELFYKVDGAGVLDYVTGWYIKAANYLKNYNQNNEEIKCAFVSTNSISQGEQVGVLWNELFKKYQIKIHFAHRTFNWSNEASRNAAVHVIIIGFSNFDVHEKYLYEYDSIKAEPHEIKVKNINPYLVEGKDIIVLKRQKPICRVPEISFGNMPNDGGFLILDDNQKKEFISKEPAASKWIKSLLSASEFLNGKNRWCLWLKGINPNELKSMPEVLKRVNFVKNLRENSTRNATKKLAAMPFLFGEIRQPESTYILIPRHSSENRKYIPLGIFDQNFIASDSCLFVANTSFYQFGMMMSEMHMTWVRNICGRIKSDFRYSNEMVYNNYPWPENPTSKQKEAVEKAAQKVLDVRKQFPESSLADLYDPLTMPPALVKAHQELDKAVDICYRSQPFTSETKRIEFLFELYERYTGGLFAGEEKKKKK